MNFDFTIHPKLSSDFLLSKISEESIMSFYLGIPLKKGLFRSPLRKDKEPTCSLFRNSKNKLIFKDFATGQYLDCWNVCMTKNNCSYQEALRIIANDFGIVKDNTLIRSKGKIDLNVPKVEEKEFSKIQIEIQDFTESELKWWSSYGITKEILKKYNVYSCKHVFLNGKLIAESKQHCPIFGYYGKKYQGKELWRCYFPKRTSYRFITNWPSKKIQGYDQLPKSGKLLVITKSMKDSMCLYSMGISSCSPNSETQFISESVLKDLKQRFKYIVVLFDLDHTGIQFSKKIKRKYPELVVTLLPRIDRCKDISDYYKTFGRKKTLEMIKNKIDLFKKEFIQ